MKTERQLHNYKLCDRNKNLTKMANIQSLVNYNSQQNQTDKIFKDLVDSFNQLKVSEQQKAHRNYSIVEFCRETANNLQKSIANLVFSN